MYKHILVPTDGSELSRSAADAAVALAKALSARVTGMHVVPSRPFSALESWIHGSKQSSAQVAADQVHEEIIKLARASAAI
jgi:nucleotide-binding universal stress UspA family protein